MTTETWNGVDRRTRPARDLALVTGAAAAEAFRQRLALVAHVAAARGCTYAAADAIVERAIEEWLQHDEAEALFASGSLTTGLRRRR